MEASPGVIFEKNHGKNYILRRHTHFHPPPPPKKTKNPAQICSNIGFWMVGDSEPRESTAYFDQLPEILPPAGVENLLEKSAWRGEAKRLPSKPEPKKQYMSTSSHLCSIPCSIDLWIASLELYLSYLSKSGGLWENRPNHRVWLTGFWRIEDCQKQCSSIMWELKKKHCNYALIFDKVPYI